jgi:hypothetical protein
MQSKMSSNSPKIEICFVISNIYLSTNNLLYISFSLFAPLSRVVGYLLCFESGRFPKETRIVLVWLEYSMRKVLLYGGTWVRCRRKRTLSQRPPWTARGISESGFGFDIEYTGKACRVASSLLFVVERCNDNGA